MTHFTTLTSPDTKELLGIFTPERMLLMVVKNQDPYDKTVRTRPARPDEWLEYGTAEDDDEHKSEHEADDEVHGYGEAIGLGLGLDMRIPDSREQNGHDRNDSVGCRPTAGPAVSPQVTPSSHDSFSSDDKPKTWDEQTEDLRAAAATVTELNEGEQSMAKRILAGGINSCSLTSTPANSSAAHVLVQSAPLRKKDNGGKVSDSAANDEEEPCPRKRRRTADEDLELDEPRVQNQIYEQNVDQKPSFTFDFDLEKFNSNRTQQDATPASPAPQDLPLLPMTSKNPTTPQAPIVAAEWVDFDTLMDEASKGCDIQWFEWVKAYSTPCEPPFQVLACEDADFIMFGSRVNEEQYSDSEDEEDGSETSEETENPQEPGGGVAEPGTALSENDRDAVDTPTSTCTLEDDLVEEQETKTILPLASPTADNGQDNSFDDSGYIGSHSSDKRYRKSGYGNSGSDSTFSDFELESVKEYSELYDEIEAWKQTGWTPEGLPSEQQLVVDQQIEVTAQQTHLEIPPLPDAVSNEDSKSVSSGPGHDEAEIANVFHTDGGDEPVFNSSGPQAAETDDAAPRENTKVSANGSESALPHRVEESLVGELVQAQPKSSNKEKVEAWMCGNKKSLDDASASGKEMLETQQMVGGGVEIELLTAAGSDDCFDGLGLDLESVKSYTELGTEIEAWKGGEILFGDTSAKIDAVVEEVCEEKGERVNLPSPPAYSLKKFDYAQIISDLLDKAVPPEMAARKGRAHSTDDLTLNRLCWECGNSRMHIHGIF